MIENLCLIYIWKVVQLIPEKGGKKKHKTENRVM